MGLILENRLEEGYAAPSERAVNVYLSVQKKYLSNPYELPRDTIITGKILDIKKVLGDLTAEEAEIIQNEIIGKDIEFILIPVTFGTVDELYISRDSWPMLRDCGILPREYSVRVILTRANYDEKSVEIYPKRDVML